ncbi:MAG: M6 family metalloprotease domain-containing protein [Bacteroidales bacterium]|jgi:M6 family metalloprotease-like protein|nr:M6 family metalloprotease domain-containing protein [Bacteroidales bacterium]
MKQTFFIFFSVIFFIKSFSVPAYPYPIVFTQPNGEQVTIIMQGDEFVKFALTLDGYTLLYNAEGYFCYAQKNLEGNLEPSIFYAEEISNRSAEANNLLSQTSKNLRYSSCQMSVYQQIRSMVENESKGSRGNTIGERKLLTILMQFPDKPFIKTQEDFNNMFNQVKYTEYGANGSVKDFFLESSYNKLDVQTTVVGPFTAKNKWAYYGNGFLPARELATEAVYAAHNSGVNFSDFTDNGEVPSFYMIFAGYGEEAGGGANCIWSHAWNIDPLYFDGVKVSSYACSPELQGGSGTNITWIGVICHEFGHSLGAPDYYDTDYGENGSYSGTGYWDLQASGSWNDNGRTPAPPNPRSKVYTYGWAEALELNSAQTVTIPSARIYDNAYYRINTKTPNEYYILENKIRGGFDDYIPSVNMLIYHCAANMSGMNTTSPQKFYPVAANSPVDLPNSGTNCQTDYGSINSPLCSWPGYTGKIDFTDNTIPAMISWNRQPTELPITNIIVNQGFISFDILGGGPKDNYFVFIPNYYGCKIIPESNSVSPVASGENFEFSISLLPSHNQSNLIVKSNGEIISPSNNIYTISNIQSDIIITIEGLQYNTINITTNAGPNGIISPSGTVAVPVGNIQHFDVTPNIGFSIENVFVDGIPVGPMSHYVFKNVSEPHAISARFKYGDKYSISVSPHILEFNSPPGVNSKEQLTTISSTKIESNIHVTAPNKFEISNNGTKWYKSFIISKAQLPYKLYIRYCPGEDELENELGKITLCATDAYAEIVLIGNIILQIDENRTSAIDVYPNPTTGKLTIYDSACSETSGQLKISNMNIFDIYGRKVISDLPCGSPQTVIDISKLSTGIYILVIQTSSGIVYKKIIKS